MDKNFDLKMILVEVQALYFYLLEKYKLGFFLKILRKMG